MKFVYCTYNFTCAMLRWTKVSGNQHTSPGKHQSISAWSFIECFLFVQSTCLPACLPTYLSACLHLSLSLSTFQSLYIYCVSACMPFCMSVFVCLSIYIPACDAHVCNTPEISSVFSNEQLMGAKSFCNLWTICINPKVSQNPSEDEDAT